MPVIYGEPTGLQRLVNPTQVVGPFTVLGSLSANTSVEAVAPAVAGGRQNVRPWNYLFAPLRVRGLTGYINSNTVPSGNSITFAAAAAQSAVGGTEGPAILAASNKLVQGGFVGAFTAQFDPPLGLPGQAKIANAVGCVLGMFATATAAGSIDVAMYLHLEP